MEIKIELMKLNKKQRDLVSELQKLGYKVGPADMSAAINGYLNTPKGEKIIEESEKIIERWKSENEE